MKKFLLIMTLGLLISSCSNEEPILEQTEPRQDEGCEYVSAIVSPDEAIEMAKNAYFSFYGKQSMPASRSEYSTSVITAPRGRSNSADTIAYIVNFDDNGYAIIKASRYTETPILAVVEDGSLSSIDEIEVPAQKAYMELLLSECVDEQPLSRADRAIILPMPVYKEVVDTLANINYGVKSDLSWGQTGVFGRYCPNSISGCAPLAMMLICAQNEKPLQMAVNFSNGTGQSVNKTITLDWGDIKKYKDKDQLPLIGEYPSSTSLDNMGLFVRQIGVIAGSIYNFDGTGTSTSSSMYYAALKTLLPEKTISSLQNYSINGIKEGLKNGPVMMRGNVVDANGGHAWVAEAYKYFHTMTYIYKGDQIGIKWELERTVEYHTESFFFNWGFDGDGNGYYQTVSEGKYTTNGKTKLTFTGLQYITIK